MIRVVLPGHLRTLAQIPGECLLAIDGAPSIADVLDALEAQYPVLRGTIRDHRLKKRRPYVRYFACERDLSHDPSEAPLPEAVIAGSAPLLIVGAMAGG